MPAQSSDRLASNRWPPLLVLAIALALGGCHDTSQLEGCAEIDCGPGECAWREGTGRFCRCPANYHDEGPRCIADARTAISTPTRIKPIGQVIRFAGLSTKVGG
jgi:hypothetical protein